MSNNPLDAFPYLQQMTQQFRQMFGDDFVQNLLKSMQMPQWPSSQNGWPGANSRFDSTTPQSGADPAASAGPRAPGGSPGTPPGGAEWPAWFGNWNPLAGGTAPSGHPGAVQLPADVFETRHEIIVIVELPGLEKTSDVRLSVMPDRVVFKGERKRTVNRSAEGTLTQAERPIGPFERTILLPARVRRQHAKASYDRGLLEIRLVKEGRSADADASIIDVDFL